MLWCDLSEMTFQSVLTDNSLWAFKSGTADSTERSYIAFADARTLYFFVLFSSYRVFAFGEFFSLRSSDAYRTMIIGNTASTGNAAFAFETSQRPLSPAIIWREATRGGKFCPVRQARRSSEGHVVGFVGSIPHPNPSRAVCT